MAQPTETHQKVVSLSLTHSAKPKRDTRKDYSHVYDANGDGVLDAAELAKRAMANGLYTAINESGDI